MNHSPTDRSRAPDLREPATRGVLRSLFGVRLFYKILVANAALVAIAVAVIAAVSHAASAAALIELVVIAALLGIVASIVVNGLILRVALGPLDRLEAAAARVRAGDLTARAPLSPLADPDLERLIRTFNETLDELTQYRERLRNVAARALDTAEEERKRIARDLHDDTAQSFVSLLLRLRTARNAATDAERTQLLDELRDELSDAIARMRRFAQGLRPPALDMLGLVPALEAHARRIAELHDLRIHIDAGGVDDLLAKPAELALYRILQEALSNVVRHARASRVGIAVRREDDRIVATVQDDGRGFDTAAVGADPDRLGLFGMEERASYIGGRIEIESEPGAGTRVRAEIPIEQAQGAMHHA